jgi:hypothetical protein
VKRCIFIAASLLVLLAAALAADRALWLTDDDSHPDAAFLREQFAGANSGGKSSISVIAINGGNWLALCLAGAGQNPQERLRNFARGKRIDVSRLQRLRAWFYVGNTPKGEIALVFVTERYSVRSRRMPNFTGNPDFRSACAQRTDAGLTWR